MNSKFYALLHCVVRCESGERITAESGGPGLGMITGLDPAEPYFQGYGPAVILDPTDAMFVEVGPLMAVSAFT